MVDLHKPRGQDVQQEAPDELDRFQRHNVDRLLCRESRHRKVTRPFSIETRRLLEIATLCV